MMTFMPYSDFRQSLLVLDRQRLGNQRSETLSMLHALLGIKQGWARHPCTLSWRGHEAGLAIYGIINCEVWQARGYVDNTKAKFVDLFENKIQDKKITFPDWFGNPKVHSSIRAVLLWKNFNWYSQFGWSELPNNEYYWGD